MDLIGFKNQIKRLSENFGESKFGEERMQIWWRPIKKYDEVDLISAVDEIMANSKTAPNLKELLVEVIASLAVRRKMANAVVGDCPDCVGGWVVPPDFEEHRTVMRCKHLGGPERLAQIIERGGGMTNIEPDPKLALKIRKTFEGISQEEFSKYGFALSDGRQE